jgi:hypothetical protein
VFTNTVKEMITELENQATLQDEMLKNLLKNLLIHSNRLFRAQMSIGEPDDSNIDFVRKFSDLVEKHFKVSKQVENYADIGYCTRIANQKTSKIWHRFPFESD